MRGVCTGQLHTKPRIIKFRTTKNFEEEKFQEHLNSAPWHVGEVFDCVEDQVCFTSTLLTDIVNEHMPFKQMCVRDQDVPHLTLEWKEAIRARRRAARLYRKTNAPDDWGRRLHGQDAGLLDYTERQMILMIGEGGYTGKTQGC